MSEPDPPAPLLGHTWVRAREEEQEEGIEVYRPEGYPLPPARGRAEFSADPNGEFHYSGIGPTDAPSKSAGRWQSGAKNEMHVELDGRDFVLEVIEVTDDLLRVRRRTT